MGFKTLGVSPQIPPAGAQPLHPNEKGCPQGHPFLAL